MLDLPSQSANLRALLLIRQHGQYMAERVHGNVKLASILAFIVVMACARATPHVDCATNAHFSSITSVEHGLRAVMPLQ